MLRSYSWSTTTLTISRPFREYRVSTGDVSALLTLDLKGVRAVNRWSAPLETTQLTENLERISRLGDLQENWDGYGAPKISAEVIDRTRRFLRSVRVDQQPAAAVPTGAGTIQLEYEEASGKYLEIDIGNTAIDVLYHLEGGEEREEEGVSASRALDIIQLYHEA